ncbi:DNA-binding protein [Paenibacillus albus]|uniref:DNA-binding protein n=1 Tax=Paenibacillus albus TaxID=2495582 RepID=A0A3S9A0B7_9BACL|nr:DNA-binding protein [Paenibacillus albus]AZN39180.1 DNA-binding protein [Paenibacillus albus]
MPDRQSFKDYNLKVKETFNATSNEVVLTVTEAGSSLGLSKDQMKIYVEKNKLTKISIMRSVHRYLLLKSEIDVILSRKK